MIFKVLNSDGRELHGEKLQWNLPQNGQPGEWMPWAGEGRLGQNDKGQFYFEGKKKSGVKGFSLYRDREVLERLGPTIYEAEYLGDHSEAIHRRDLIYVREARLLRKFHLWNERVAILFACDCMAHGLHLSEKCPSGIRPKFKLRRDYINAVRSYARGEISAENLEVARRAARGTIFTATWLDTREGAWKAACQSAESVAWSEAFGTIMGGSGVGYESERDWQLDRLMWYLEGRDKMEGPIQQKLSEEEGARVQSKLTRVMHFIQEERGMKAFSKAFAKLRANPPSAASDSWEYGAWRQAKEVFSIAGYSLDEYTATCHEPNLDDALRDLRCTLNGLGVEEECWIAHENGMSLRLRGRSFQIKPTALAQEEKEG